MNYLLIIIGKIISFISIFLNQGNGSTWPGHIALNVNKNFIREILGENTSVILNSFQDPITTRTRQGMPKQVRHDNKKVLKVILVAGTNGKTTTTKLLRHILEKNGLRVFQNDSGANLLNGVASSIIQHADLSGVLNYDVAIFEIDENTLPLILKEITPNAIVILNLFRDQLDRYGEVNSIAKHWEISLEELQERIRKDSGLSQNDNETQLFINGNDPELSYIGQQSKLKVHYFGIDEKLMEKKEASHDVDFLYCPRCQHKLNFSKMSYSHLGLFTCPNCNYRNPKVESVPNLPYSLFGTYNIYNTNAAALIAHKAFGVGNEPLKQALKDFKPAFGRQEVIEYKGRKIVVLLSKNPAGFNQSLDAISQTKKGTILLALNDRIPDGRDVSWIWDVDFENVKNSNIFISGERAYDMGLRIKYADIPDTEYQILENLEDAVESAIKQTQENETLFILPTYSAMLEVRKILKGRKIL